jgi:hypothetical protein
MSARQCSFDQFDRSLRVRDFDDQLVVPFILQFNDDRVLRIVDIPEDPLAVLIEGASRHHSGNVGARHSQPVPPAVRYGWVCPDLTYVRQRNFERTLEGPQLVGSSDVEDQIATRRTNPP